MGPALPRLPGKPPHGQDRQQRPGPPADLQEIGRTLDPLRATVTASDQVSWPQLEACVLAIIRNPMFSVSIYGLLYGNYHALHKRLIDSLRRCAAGARVTLW